MTSNNSSNFGFGTAGQLVKSNGAGAAVGFTTATYPSTAGTISIKRYFQQSGSLNMKYALTTGRFS